MEPLKINTKQLEDMAKAMGKICETIKAAMIKVCVAIKKFVVSLMKNPPVGWKNWAKRAKLNYYESISTGRSNNWRKMHGLHLARRNI